MRAKSALDTLRFDEVVFLDDFFRCSDNGLHSHPANRRFLRAFFERQFIACEVRVREESARCDGGKIPVDALIRALGLEPSPAGWAAAGIACLKDVLTDVYPLNLGPRSLVIGWGLPASVLRYIDGRGACFIDIEVAPLRFGRHLYLHARTNDRHVEGVLQAFEIDLENFRNEVALLKAYFARRGADWLIDSRLDVGLFAGQTSIDLTLVSNGRINKPADCIEQVRAWASEVDLLLVKSHPYADDSSQLVALVQRIPNAQWVGHNTYAMLCASNLRFVAALSSGVLQEARLFGIPSRQAFEPDCSSSKWLPGSCSRWITVNADIGSAHAVKRLLERPARRRFWSSMDRQPLVMFPADAVEAILGLRWGLDAQALGLPAPFILEENRQYLFGVGHDSKGWLAVGWNAPEEWGVWSNGAACRLTLPLGSRLSSIDGLCRLVLVGRLLRLGEHAVKVVGVEIDGRAFQPAVSEPEGEPVTVIVEFEGHHWHRRSFTTVTLYVDGAVCPSDIGGAHDLRTLGFGLERLIVEVAPLASDDQELNSLAVVSEQ